MRLSVQSIEEFKQGGFYDNSIQSIVELIMPTPPALATPPTTAPTSPASPTSTFSAAPAELSSDVDLEKADALAQDTGTTEKGEINWLVQGHKYSATFTQN